MVKNIKVLNETDTELLLHIVSPSKKDSVLEETIEEKKLASYDRTIKYIMSLNTCDPSTLTSET